MYIKGARKNELFKFYQISYQGKKNLLITFFLALMIFGFFVIASQSPTIAPFLYAIF